MDESEIFRFIEELTRLSAAEILPHFANPDLQIENKSDHSPVTIADRNAERALRAAIRQRFPEHGIIGEELGSEAEDAEYVWVLDPIDGTRAFTAGVPLFGTLICLMRNGEPWIGAIHQPVCNQLFLGNGKEAWLNGKRIRVRQNADLSKATLATWDLDFPAQHQSPERWRALLAAVGQKRTWGDCYAYALLASGGIDIACDVAMKPWDFMALIPVVRGAGGTFTDWQGSEDISGDTILATTPELKDAVLNILNA